MAYVNVATSLPRSLDVQISLSKAQQLGRRDLSILCVVAENLGFLPDANRIRFYSTQAAVETDFAEGTEPYKAAQAFFAQTPRAVTMAIAEAFDGAQKALLVSQPLSAADIALIEAEGAGSMTIVHGPGAVAQDLTAMDFTGVATIEAIAAIIDAKTGAGLTCVVKTLPGGQKRLVIETVATGDTATITFPVAAGVGTNVSALLKLTAATGASICNGYTPTGIAGELTNIRAAANAAGKYVYGYCLDAGFRDVATQTAAAAWVLTQTAFMPLVTNDVTAYDPAYTDDIGSVLNPLLNSRVSPIYHDNPDVYPDVSILAYMLSVNYQIADSAVTAKFKALPGIASVELTETQWSALREKGYNSYTMMDGGVYTYRDGNTEHSGYYMDSTINFDNFIEDLGTNIYNVFLRNKKIPYTRAGQLLLSDPCFETGSRYVFNGVFADREVENITKKSGVKIIPAVQVIPTPITQMSAGDRAARVAPPIQMIVQEAGAMHSVAIAVEVVS